MARARTFLPTALLALACLLVVSLGAPLHHHAGPAADCAVCQAAGAPVVAAPAPGAVDAPATVAVARFLEPLTGAGRLAPSTASARAPPVAFSDEA